MKKTIKALAAVKGISTDDPPARELTLAEYDLDYKVRPANPNHSKERVYYYHQAAAVNLRREILFSIGE